MTELFVPIQETCPNALPPLTNESHSRAAIALES